MIIRQARESDFAHLETFVWQAVFPTFDRDGLSDEQRAENDELVEGARTRVIEALSQPHTGVFVAIDPRLKTLAGYVIADAAPRAYAELRELIVKRGSWGKGVGEALLDEAINHIGTDRAISVAVRHYNARALAFFQKHSFVDTGETTGDHAIPRTLLLREAGEEPVVDRSSDVTPTREESPWDDFPTAADEPVFAELPDYRLAVDEDEPLFATGTNALTVSETGEDTGETTLSEEQLTELEAFIARARARKGAGTATDESPATASSQASAKAVPSLRNPPRQAPAPEPTATTAKPVEVGAEIELEVTPAARKPAFEFAFEEEPVPVKEKTLAQKPRATVEKPESVAAAPKPTEKTSATQAKKDCPDCGTELPAAARFCYNCGFPQVAPATGETAAAEPAEELLELEELSEPGITTPDSEEEVLELDSLSPEESVDSTTEPIAISGAATSDQLSEINEKQFSLAELKTAFREQLQDRVSAYFGARKVKAYVQLLEENTNFQQLRDGSLSSLQQWINGGQRTVAAATERLDNTLADLVEYFIVETAGDLSGRVLPQRLLRHQSVDWTTVDLFRLVMDYLDFDNETERIFTDFVAMPARALRNATASFLKAGKDERVFFICDQSLISAAKNGFAVTDSGLYWKNVLQPAGSILFNELTEVQLAGGHLELNKQFFNAGGTLNLKMAVLLDKLRRR